MDTTEELSASSDERKWSAIAHLSALFGLLCPLLNIIVPMAVWLTKRNELPMVDDEGKEAVNFQVSVTLYLALCIPAMLIGIGGYLFIIILFVSIFLSIKAALRASSGEEYSYPFTLRLIK